MYNLAEAISEDTAKTQLQNAQDAANFYELVLEVKHLKEENLQQQKQIDDLKFRCHSLLEAQARSVN